MSAIIQSKKLIAVICLISCISFNSDAQNLWMKYYDNPVLTGAHLSWYSVVTSPSVIYEQDTFKMWFRGYTGAGLNQQIGYAWSLNGWDWEVDTLPVIPLGLPGAWDRSKTSGQVIRMNDTLKMWYIGTDDLDVYQTGYAWALDEQNWNRYEIPVLTPGPPGSWDEKYACGGPVTYDGSMYHTYYLGSDNNGIEGVGYASSTNGINWVKFTNNPILEPGAPGTFYEMRLIPSCILLEDNTVFIYVAGYAIDFTVRIGYFVTEIGDWTNLEVGNFGQPVLDVGTGGAWDDRRVTLPSVLNRNDSLYMWYEGKKYMVLENKIGLATDFEIPHPSNCLPEGILFSTQAEIDSFQINYPYCTEIEGNVSISGGDITSLIGLSALTSIGGALWISDNDTLTNLSGLQNIASIGGDLGIYGNPVLTSLLGLNNVTSIGNAFMIEYNYSLTSLSDIDNLSSIGNDLIINVNPALTSLSGLENMTSIGGNLKIYSNMILASLSGLENVTFIEGFLDVSNNDALSSLSGLDNVTSIGDELWIQLNYNLTSLSGIDKLTSIGGDLHIENNSALTSLSGLENMTSIGGLLGIYSNDALISLTGLGNIEATSITKLDIYFNDTLSTCEVESICTYVATPNGEIEIHDNAIGCNSPEEVLDSCEANAVIVDEYSLFDAYSVIPNPFTTSTTLNYTLDKPSTVTINIFSPQGQLIDKIEQEQPKGEQKVEWNAEGLPTGMYYFRIQAGDMVGGGKMVKME